MPYLVLKIITIHKIFTPTIADFIIKIQALDLGQNQQNQLKSQQPQHKPSPQPAPQQHTTIKHEQVGVYLFMHIAYSSFTHLQSSS